MGKQLFPILENFVSVLTHVLAVPDGETSDCGLKMEVLKVSNIVFLFIDTYYLDKTRFGSSINSLVIQKISYTIVLSYLTGGKLALELEKSTLVKAFSD